MSAYLSICHFFFHLLTSLTTHPHTHLSFLSTSTLPYTSLHVPNTHTPQTKITSLTFPGVEVEDLRVAGPTKLVLYCYCRLVVCRGFQVQDDVVHVLDGPGGERSQSWSARWSVGGE